MSQKSRLDRFLSLFTDIRAGEGTTAVLMLANIFLLLVCYSVIKTVREPLILLGGGAEVRSYAAAGQALVLMAFVPAYAWLASRVDRVRLLMTVSAFFIACIELFSAAVAARVPYVGVAFFIWVGVFNMSLVAQFWSFANDIYRKEAGDRLFPIIAVGMTAGAPLGSFAAGRLFQSGAAPSLILQVAAVLLTASIALYNWIDARERQQRRDAAQPLETGGGFRLVLANPYLRLIAALVVLLNVVNTTGEYLVARLLSAHVTELAQANAAFDKQAYIGAFSGQYQFWVNITALLLQAFVTSRVVKHRGLRGALLALPLIALGGYAVIAAGVGFSVVRWVKTAENATDYSIMNTARQLLWLPTTREEKYKAKQAVDAFFVRFGDVISAGVVYAGAHVIGLSVQQFAMVNVVMTLVWLGIALSLVGFKPSAPALPRVTTRRLAGAAAMVLFVLAALPASAQESGNHTRACAGASAESLASGTLHGLVRVPDKGSLAILGVGAAGALATHPADFSVTDAFREEPGLRPVFKPGATLGGMPFEVGAAAALMAIGQSSKHPCLASLGSELLQAQLVGAAWTIGVKQLARRDRPEGTGYSFPSGHTATAFASATVLQRRFGWKAGIPAYAVASYVAASRVDMQRHYLSDVIFGAAVGMVAGRNVTVGTHRFEVGPIATSSGAAIGVSLMPPR